MRTILRCLRAKNLGSRWPALLGLLLLATGCSHYQWGSATREPPYQKIALDPILNRTALPQAEIYLAQQLPGELSRSGTLTPLPPDTPADASLQVILTDFTRRERVAQPDDTGRGRIFSLTLHAEVTLTSTADGDLLLDRAPFQATVELSDEGDATRAEATLTPHLTQDLARQVARRLLHPW